MKVFCFILGLLSGLMTFVIAAVSFLVGAGLAVTDNTRSRHQSMERQTYGVYSK